MKPGRSQNVFAAGSISFSVGQAGAIPGHARYMNARAQQPWRGQQTTIQRFQDAEFGRRTLSRPGKSLRRSFLEYTVKRRSAKDIVSVASPENSVPDRSTNTFQPGSERSAIDVGQPQSNGQLKRHAGMSDGR
jgi:hypothetical protein